MDPVELWSLSSFKSIIFFLCTIAELKQGLLQKLLLQQLYDNNVMICVIFSDFCYHLCISESKNKNENETYSIWRK